MKNTLEIRVLDTLKESRLFFDLRMSKAVPLFIFSIILLFTVFFIWASCAKMDDVIKTQAVLRPVENISTIRSLTAGEVYVKNYTHDSFVEEGEKLLQFDTRSDTLELKNSREYLNQLIEDTMQYLALENTIKKNETDFLKTDTESLLLSKIFIVEYTQLLEQKEQITQKLEREKKQPESMQTINKIKDLESDVLQNEQQLIAWRDKALVDVQEKIKTVRQQSQTLERRISDLERIIKNATIIAPISGRIDETQQINIGDFVFNGEELFRIVPESATALKAEILVDPSAIARIQKGQKVSLRFPSLPPSRFGQLEGIVSLIPADVKISGTNAYFLLEATIPNPYLIAQNGEKIFLRSGVSAQGRIIIDQDSVLRMILRKIDFLR